MTPGQSQNGADLAHRRKVVAATGVVGSAMLGASLSTTPGSRRFYALTLGTAAVWLTGGLAAGPLHLGQRRAPAGTRSRSVTGPALVGAAAFAAFYGSARVCRRVPRLDRALTEVLSYAHQGSDALVMLTTLANGAAEEVFFRGALYAAAGSARPALTSTLGYVAATSTTGNPALVLASVAMGALLALVRRESGGILAPVVTHLTWSALMVRFLPPLFRHEPRDSGSGG